MFGIINHSGLRLFASTFFLAGKKSCYFTTRKGKDFLKKFKSYMRRSERLDREIGKVNYERKLLEAMALGKEFKK